MSEQRNLLSTEPTVHRDRVYEGFFMGRSWLARCPDCRTIISRYDDSEESARAGGRDALTRTDRWGHHCVTGRSKERTLASPTNRPGSVGAPRARHQEMRS